MEHYKIDDTLTLVHVSAPAAPKTVDKPANVNHFVMVDCSGSMAGDLPNMASQIVKKLPAMLTPGDTFTLGWFSGKGQFGTVLEVETVETLKDVKRIGDLVAKWLRPIGLTGFKEPLELVASIVKKHTGATYGKKPVMPWSMTFLSDGCDNQSTDRALILRALEEATKSVAAVTIVEYGYYADRAFLAKMAEKAGGVHIFAEDFPSYEPVFDALVKKKGVTQKRIRLELEGEPVEGLAWSLSVAEHEIASYAIEATAGGKLAVEVPEGTSGVWFLSRSTPTGANVKAPKGANVKVPTDVLIFDAVYAAKALFGVRMKPEIVFALLKRTGDIRFIERFANCFGKQAYSDFCALAVAATFDAKQRLVDGCDPGRIPKEDAFCLVELLRILAEDEHNRVLLDHKEFRYSRIGRQRVAAEGALRFEPTMLAGAAGYSVEHLVFNSDEPNISVNVRKEGTVDLGPTLAQLILKGELGELGKLPVIFETQTIRNYAIVKDGLVNVEKLPVLITVATAKELHRVGLISASELCAHTSTVRIKDTEVQEYVFRLRGLPIINRKMVRTLSAKEVFLSHYKMHQAKAAQKVFGHYYRERLAATKGVGRTSEGLEARYGTAAALWLKEQGLTDQGFSPRSTLAEARDFYMGKELKIGLKGLSSLPKVEEVIERYQRATREAGEERGGSPSKGKKEPKEPKLPPISARLMKPYIDEYDAFALANKARLDKVLGPWLDGQQVLWRTRARQLMAAAAQTAITIIVGQTWFSEFKDLSENTMTIETADGPIECKAELRELKIEV